MAEKPIIFSGPMVQALLDGCKTQTRRVLKPQPLAAFLHEGRLYDAGDGSSRRMPYAPGDRLWVREAWTHEDLSPDPDNPDNPDPPEPTLLYRADRPGHWCGPWRSPIHMPRWASRLTLVVRDLRVQRVQEISAEDALAEGIDRTEGSFTAFCDYEDFPDDHFEWFSCPKASFRSLWNSIYGKGAWDRNPWVCALTFTVHRCNIDAMEAA